jgi:hypothetical protein
LSEPHPTGRVVAGSVALDVVLVTAFAAIGRASHAEDLVAGLWQTAWPFLAALVVGWVVTLAWRAPTAPVRSGVGIWAVTLIGGMLLRAVSSQGTALAFVIVAAIVLLAFLVGWRLIAAVMGRRRLRRPTLER